jgi:hypothetical protein
MGSVDSLPVIGGPSTPRSASPPCRLPARPRYVEVGLRIAYVDEGPDGAAPGTSCRDKGPELAPLIDFIARTPQASA